MPPGGAPAAAAHLADRLAEAGIEYALGGALALAAHGVPRMTKDVDLSVWLPEPEIDRLFDALERAGCLFDRERARDEVARLALARVRCGGVLADLFVAFHPHHHAALGRRVRLALPDGVERWFLSPEDLAVLKLALGRPKDLADLAGLVAVQGPRLDRAYVRAWVEAIVPAGDPRRAALADLFAG